MSTSRSGRPPQSPLRGFGPPGRSLGGGIGSGGFMGVGGRIGTRSPVGVALLLLRAALLPAVRPDSKPACVPFFSAACGFPPRAPVTVPRRPRPFVPAARLWRGAGLASLSITEAGRVTSAEPERPF